MKSEIFEKIIKIEGNKIDIKPPKKIPQPILSPSREGFDSRNTYNPAVIKEKDRIVMLYRAESKEDKLTGRIGLAISYDGINFFRHPEPVIEPEYKWESVGVEDPRIVKVGKTYYMTYTGYDGKTARLCLATSKNMLTWKKHGPIFEGFEHKKNGIKGWTKSGAILPKRLEKGNFKGNYLMYFGDSNIWMAVSKDLVNWEYMKEPVLSPRERYFDNVLVEPGPPLFETSYGITLIYNSAGRCGEGLKYKVGLAIFDKEYPDKVVARTETPLMVPQYEWELYGHVNNVVFIEGMVEHENKILLYYGGADRHIGLAYWTTDL
ncbi:glycosidase [Thermococcus bergensis]|uniref:glycoside hydrolase family 130 protein n=1 Tax=Thermococcus bergensis TaxID=2689387 RepID=UPI001CECC38F|nr:glycoside hydrolase family 130 protein [Thermococcus bergensis]MCA6213168.1 glycosidase [Thermococcus bergensis]